MEAKLQRFLVRELSADPKYARNLNERHVARLVEAFNPEALGILVVNQRKDGKLILVDGNHRVAAMKALGRKDDAVETLLFRGMDIRDEARLFASLNTQLQVHGTDIFRAKVIAEDPDAVKINSAVRAAGYHVSRGTEAKAIRAAGTLHTLHRHGVLETTLEVCAKAWPDLTEELPSLIMRGIGALLDRYPTVDRRDLARRLSARPARRWMLEWREIARASSQNVSKVALLNLVQTYNRNRPVKTRLGRLAGGDLDRVGSRGR